MRIDRMLSMANASHSDGLVRKKLWTRELAYKLIHTIMTQSASQHGIQPRTISFQGVMQTLDAFQLLLELQGNRSSKRNGVLDLSKYNLLHAISTMPILSQNPDLPRFDSDVQA